MVRASVQSRPGDIGAPHSFVRRSSHRLAAWSLDKARLLAPWRGWWLIPLLALVFCLYAFFGSAGRMFKAWPLHMAEYDLLSDAFRHGHTYLSVAPDPRLVAAPNPYDPANSHLWVLDWSYYNGKYYLYWGPVPPLLQALVKAALGINWTIGDQYIAYAAWCIGATAGSILICRLSARLFGQIPRTLLIASILAFAFANPIVHLIGNAGVYQSAISAGQGFLWVGVALASEALFRAQTGRSYSGACLLAGLAFALAMGSRLSLSLAMIPISALTALFIGFAGARPAKPPRPWVTAAKAAFLMGLPMALCVAGLMLYNKTRFDNYFESGIKLQLSAFPFRFSLSYFPASLYAYLFEKFRLSGEFPWLFQQSRLGGSGLPDWIDIPPGYVDIEPHVGLLRGVPIVWLAPLAITTLFGVIRPNTWRKRGSRATLYTHACLTFATAGSVTAIPVLGLYFPSMRYLADFTSGLVLLGIMGGLSFYTWARNRPTARKVIAATICTLSALTVVCGLLIGYQGYTGPFKTYNPKLHEALKKRLSF
jgi:hypothetical protein